MRKAIGLMLIIGGAFVGYAIITYWLPVAPQETKVLVNVLAYVCATCLGFGGICLTFRSDQDSEDGDK